MELVNVGFIFKRQHQSLILGNFELAESIDGKFGHESSNGVLKRTLQL